MSESSDDEDVNDIPENARREDPNAPRTTAVSLATPLFSEMCEQQLRELASTTTLAGTATQRTTTIPVGVVRRSTRVIPVRADPVPVAAANKGKDRTIAPPRVVDQIPDIRTYSQSTSTTSSQVIQSRDPQSSGQSSSGQSSSRKRGNPGDVMGDAGDLMGDGDSELDANQWEEFYKVIDSVPIGSTKDTQPASTTKHKPQTNFTERSVTNPKRRKLTAGDKPKAEVASTQFRIEKVAEKGSFFDRCLDKIDEYNVVYDDQMAGDAFFNRIHGYLKSDPSPAPGVKHFLLFIPSQRAQLAYVADTRRLFLHKIAIRDHIVPGDHFDFIDNGQMTALSDHVLISSVRAARQTIEPKNARGEMAVITKEYRGFKFEGNTYDLKYTNHMMCAKLDVQAAVSDLIESARSDPIQTKKREMNHEHQLKLLKEMVNQNLLVLDPARRVNVRTIAWLAEKFPKDSKLRLTLINNRSFNAAKNMLDKDFGAGTLEFQHEPRVCMFEDRCGKIALEPKGSTFKQAWAGCQHRRPCSIDGDEDFFLNTKPKDSPDGMVRLKQKFDKDYICGIALPITSEDMQFMSQHSQPSSSDIRHRLEEKAKGEMANMYPSPFSAYTPHDLQQRDLFTEDEVKPHGRRKTYRAPHTYHYSHPPQLPLDYYKGWGKDHDDEYREKDKDALGRQLQPRPYEINTGSVEGDLTTNAVTLTTREREREEGKLAAGKTKAKPRGGKAAGRGEGNTYTSTETIDSDSDEEGPGSNREGPSSDRGGPGSDRERPGSNGEISGSGGKTPVGDGEGIDGYILPTTKSSSESESESDEE